MKMTSIGFDQKKNNNTMFNFDNGQHQIGIDYARLKEINPVVVVEVGTSST